LLSIWGVFAVIGSLISVAVFWEDLLTYNQLKRSGIPAKGTVITKEPENHNSVRYSYEVGQQTYSGIGHGGSGNPSFESLKIGDPLLVYYDPARPSFSCLGYPDYYFRSQVAGIVFVLVVLPLVGMFSLYRRGDLKRWHVIG